MKIQKENSKKANRIKESKSDLYFYSINTSLIIVAFVIFLYPLVFIVSASFSSGSALLSNRVILWPVEFNLDGYKAVFDYRLILIGFRNSFFYMIVGTFINLTITIMAGYPLSRKDLVGKKYILLMFTVTMFFNSGLIPAYMLIKGLGMRNTIWAMLIPGAMSVWNMLVTRSFFIHTLSDELLEASQIDGCSDFRFIWEIALPLSAPIIAVMGLFYAVGHWNSYFNALIYLDSTELYPLQIVLRQVLIMNTIDFSMLSSGSIRLESEAAKFSMRELLKYSLIVVSSLPVLAIYPFVQKYFVKGMMLGSIKG